MKIAERMPPGEKGKVRLDTGLDCVGVSYKILVTQPQESRMPIIVSSRTLALPPHAVIAKVLAGCSPVFTGYYCARVAHHIDDIQPGIPVKDMAQMFDIIRLLRNIEAPVLCHGIENALFMFTMAIALETGR